MKKAITYLLLLFYCAIPLRPLLVLLTDAIAHTLNKMEHLATVHYENGRYHLHNELKALHESESEKEKTSKQTATYKVKISDSEQISTPLKIKFPISSQTINTSHQIESELLSGFLKIPFMPPKLA